MPTEGEYQRLHQLIAAFRSEVTGYLAGDLAGNPPLIDAIDREFSELREAVMASDMAEPAPPDKGLAALIGLGPEAATSLGTTRMPAGVIQYDETIASERLVATGDLYYIYQHERIGVFRVAQKLQQTFKAGTVRLSTGPGAFGLYQFDKRQVLRYTRRDRYAAYRRVFGYGLEPVPQGARPNPDFHRLFTFFINQVSAFWRDKRISDVIRERAHDPSFGSIAMVRRAGLDLRNNMKWASYGHVNVLRVEVMQLLDEAFRVLNTDDIKKLFGADNAWDVIEEVISRYFREEPITSPRQRMAVAGRDILAWLAQPHILEGNRLEFEAKLSEISDEAEEWLTSAKAIGIARRSPRGTVATASRSRPPLTPPSRANGRRPPHARVPEYEW